jgi:hypothetical protein
MFTLPFIFLVYGDFLLTLARSPFQKPPEWPLSENRQNSFRVKPPGKGVLSLGHAKFAMIPIAIESIDHLPVTSKSSQQRKSEGR